MKDFLSASVAILICELAGFVGAIFTMPAIDVWYANLNKSALNPPSWIFGPVWTTLFALMGIAAYLVWRRGWEKPKVKVALYLFGIQLLLNILWSFLFFGQRDPLAALMEISVLWLAILMTLVFFRRVSRVAGWLLVPYLAWVSFAIYLNYAVWALNRI